MSEQDKDAEILFPDQTLEVGGEQVTVREFRYAEGLQAAVIGKPIMTTLRRLIQGDDEIDAEAIDDLIAEHADTWMQLISLSTGKGVEWISKLGNDDGMLLSMVFWEVNGPFFMKRLVMAATVGQTLAAKRSRSQSSLHS